MIKENIFNKNLKLKRALAILLASSMGFNLMSFFGTGGKSVAKIKNENKNNDVSISDSSDDLEIKYIDNSYDFEKIDEKSEIKEQNQINKTEDKNKEQNKKALESLKKEKKKEEITKQEPILEEIKEDIFVDDEPINDYTKEDKFYEYSIPSALKKKFNTLNDGCFNIQGACITNDSIIVARKRLDIDKTYLYKLNKDTLEVEKIVNSASLGHCNDMTYNPDANLIFVTGNNNYNDITVLNADTLELIASSKTSHKYFAISYDPDSKLYVTFGGKKMYILNEFFEEINSFDVPTNLTKQGIAVKDGLIYYLCWEKGVVSLNQTSTNLKRANTNYIFVYNFNGELKTTYYLPNFKGEGESLVFNGDELLVTINGFNTGEWSFYSVDLNKENSISKNKIK